MYHNAVGPMAATGLGAGSALYAFTPMGLIWALLATFAVIGAVGALMRVLPSPRRRQRVPEARQPVSAGASA
jgi:hypothetical protein